MAGAPSNKARIGEGVWRVHGAYKGGKHRSADFCGYLSAHTDGEDKLVEHFALQTSVAFPLTTSFFLVRQHEIDPIKTDLSMKLWVQGDAEVLEFPENKDGDYPDPPRVMRDDEFQVRTSVATYVNESAVASAAGGDALTMSLQVDEGFWIVFEASRINGGKRQIGKRLGFVTRFKMGDVWHERSSYAGTDGEFVPPTGDLFFYKHSEHGLIELKDYEDFVEKGTKIKNVPELGNIAAPFGKDADYIRALWGIS